ncbi:ArnT family glycosyltransferase [Nakamurella alba]|nr:glycosyltransferase family 39 protein [Nakamurella alba]
MTLTAPHPAVDGPAPATPTRSGRNRWQRAVLGDAADPRWARPLLWALVVGTAALYLTNLTSSGYANEFYAAAVKSGTESWTAWLFGSLDSANSITVDKPPGSLWLMVLSARIFGFSSFSLLLPQALMGVGTVALTYATVRRWSGHGAGLAAGALVALTPVAALMFRFDNPDALLVLLMTLGAYCVTRAIEDAPGRRSGRSTALRWLLLAGAAIGFAFLTKMLQGLLVLPGFGLAYLVAGRARLRTRLWHLLAALGAMIVSAGWFVALVALWPADSRPYIGGSTNNSLWELALGYNGLGRILGGDGNGGGGGGGTVGGNTGFGGATGLGRMFGSAFGTEISWLLPAALLAVIAGVWFTRAAPRTDRVRASLILWGGWLFVTALVLSFMEGTVHPYYAVALAPAIAATVAVAGRELWRGRSSHLARGALAAMIAVTAVWGWYLLQRNAADWLPWLRWVVLVGGLAGAALLLVSAGRLKKLAVAAVLVGTITSLGATTAWTVATAAQAHSGSIPTSGPASTSSQGGFGAGGGGGSGGGRGMVTSSGTSGSSGTELTAALDATTTRWSAAVIGDQSAAGYILSTDTAVMAIGGWSGSDDSPTLEQFQQYVADGEITYFIASGGGMGGMGGGGTGGGAGGSGDTSASQITAWVEANYTATTIGGTTVYVLNS